jgi:multiple sugar transport system ATP-binding protein
MPKISLKNITKKFGKVIALNDLKIDIKDGEFFVILGPSGAGKTTFLKVLAGLESPESGEIYFDEDLINNIPTPKRDVALTFENYSLYPNFTVFGNIASPLKSPANKGKYDSGKIRERVYNIAKMLNIDQLLDRLPSELSGGQKQRVALGRALIKEPKILLLDEPLAHVDAKIRNQLRTEFHFLKEKFKTTTIYTSHDYKEAISLGDRIMFLDKGKIQQIGSPEEVYNFPKNIVVAKNVGWPDINLFKCYIKPENNNLYCPEGDFAFNVSGKILKLLKKYGEMEYIIGARPHNISFSEEHSDKYNIEAVCGVTEALDNQLIINVKIKNMDLILSIDNPDLYLRKDQKLWIHFNDQSLMFFDKKTSKNVK